MAAVEAAGAPSGLRRVVLKALLVLFSVGVALVLAELTLRVAVPEKQGYRVWPPSMHHTFHPNPAVMPLHAKETRFVTNSLGLRGVEPGPDSEVRVLAIGGSTTENLYIDQEVAWALRIGALLTSDEQRVWAASAGLSGMGSGDHIVHAKFLLPQLPRIDVVVTLLGVNDLALALGTPEKYRPTPGDLVASQVEARLRRAFQQVPGPVQHSWEYDAAYYRRLQVFQLVKRLKDGRSRDLATTSLTNNDDGTSMTRWREKRRTAPEIIDTLPDLSEPLATYRTNLRTYAGLVKERGIRLILITQPALWRADLSPEDQKRLWMGGKGDYQHNDGVPYFSVRVLAEGLAKLNEVTLSVCEETGVECLDLASMIPKDTEHFYDDCHFGDATSKQIADLVAGAIRKGPPFTQ